MVYLTQYCLHSIIVALKDFCSISFLALLLEILFHWICQGLSIGPLRCAPVMPVHGRANFTKEGRVELGTGSMSLVQVASYIPLPGQTCQNRSMSTSINNITYLLQDDLLHGWCFYWVKEQMFLRWGRKNYSFQGTSLRYASSTPNPHLEPFFSFDGPKMHFSPEIFKVP